MVNKIVFYVSDNEINSGDSWRYILASHISYFTDKNSLNKLLKHIGEENPFYKHLIYLANSFGHRNPRQSSQRWSYIEPELRDLVGKITYLDQTKRITAREALPHRWFSEASLKFYSVGMSRSVCQIYEGNICSEKPRNIRTTSKYHATVSVIVHTVAARLFDWNPHIKSKSKRTGSKL